MLDRDGNVVEVGHGEVVAAGLDEIEDAAVDPSGVAAGDVNREASLAGGGVIVVPGGFDEVGE